MSITTSTKTVYSDSINGIWLEFPENKRDHVTVILASPEGNPMRIVFTAKQMASLFEAVSKEKLPSPKSPIVTE